MNKPTYLFDSNQLYFRRPRTQSQTTGSNGHECASDFLMVAPGELVAYDVEPAGNRNIVSADAWDFKIQGHSPDVIYRTHYTWALVLNTPDNVERLKARNVLDGQVEALKAKLRLANRNVIKVNVANLEAGHE